MLCLAGRINSGAAESFRAWRGIAAGRCRPCLSFPRVCHLGSTRALNMTQAATPPRCSPLGLDSHSPLPWGAVSLSVSRDFKCLEKWVCPKGCCPCPMPTHVFKNVSLQVSPSMNQQQDHACRDPPGGCQGSGGWWRDGRLGLAGVDFYKSEWIYNKVLLYRTGNCVHYPPMNHNDKKTSK